jgi:hypothetical protein
LFRYLALFPLIALACSKPGPCAGKDLLVEVSGNHAHTERVPADEMKRGAGSYKLEGGSHEHNLRLNDATLARLRGGEAVELRSSGQNGHVHALRLRCGT